MFASEAERLAQVSSMLHGGVFIRIEVDIGDNEDADAKV
jgi:hypothetical protein